MNSIARIILRGVVSGHVTLTPRVLGALKEVSQNHPAAGEPADSSPEPAGNPGESGRRTPSTDKHLTFINPLPGRWIRRMDCVLACALVLGAGLLRAGSTPGSFEEANQAYARGNFAAAAQGCENIIAQQGWSAPVLFNLANARQCAGQPGAAILNYERAALLAPRDPDIAANLQRARQTAGLATGPGSRLESVSKLMTLSGWAGFAVTSLFLLSAALSLKQLRPRLRRALNWGGVTAAFVLAIAAAAMVVRWSDLDRAVVMAPEVAACVSPVTTAEPLFKLRVGEIVSWRQSHGDYALVENQAGREGWVKTREVTRVIPVPGPTTVPGA